MMFDVMSRYYVHKVGFQEMGSIGKEGGSPKRGRYFLISKKFLDFFPHLSSVVLNDKILISIIPMYLHGHAKVWCTMDYHNQRFADIAYTKANPRNEVRLYMNSEIDPGYLFREGDYVVFERIESEGLCYALTRITPADAGYQDLSEKSKGKTNFGIIDELPYITRPTFGDREVRFAEDAYQLLGKESDSILLHESKEAEDDSLEIDRGAAIFTSTLFRELVMNAYQYRCAVTGRVMRYTTDDRDLFNLEAAHIQPQAHKGTFLPCNGIALCRDMHFAFDKGFFTIADDYTIVVSEKLADTWLYQEYNGKKIFIPKDEFFRPHKKFLSHHRKYVFESFAQIRRM